MGKMMDWFAEDETCLPRMIERLAPVNAYATGRLVHLQQVGGYQASTIRDIDIVWADHLYIVDRHGYLLVMPEDAEGNVEEWDDDHIDALQQMLLEEDPDPDNFEDVAARYEVLQNVS